MNNKTIIKHPAPQELIDALKEHSWHRGREGWHCCLTGKDADLESHGEQHIRIDGIDNVHVCCTVSVGKTFAGSDICLNLPEGKEDDEAFYEEAREEWLDQATEVVCGCGVAGEWDGDSWYMYEEIPFRVRARQTPQKTAMAIVEKAQELLTPLEKELALADEILNALSGWTDGKGHAFPEGKPGPSSVGYYLSHKEE